MPKATNQDSVNVVEAKQSIKASELIFPENFRENIPFLVTESAKLYEARYSERDMKLFSKRAKNLFESDDFEDYSKFISILKEASRQFENIDPTRAKIASDEFYSQAAQELIATIEGILSTPQSYEEMILAFEQSKSLIETSVSLVENEKNFLLYLLATTKYVAENGYEESSAPNGRIAKAPKCNFFQWGCAFATYASQNSLLIAIWIANWGTPLQTLVVNHGLIYIAQCCLWCNCKCEAGCPRLF